jgi:hypothetical protein
VYIDERAVEIEKNRFEFARRQPAGPDPPDALPL